MRTSAPSVCRWRAGFIDETNNDPNHYFDETEPHRITISDRTKQSRSSSSLDRKTKPTNAQSLAERTLHLTTRTAFATARHSGKAMYHLMKPKHVDKEELLGLWRLDQQICIGDMDPLECSATIELTASSILVTMYDDEDTSTEEAPWTFQPATWPWSAKVEFTAKAFMIDPSHRDRQTFRYKGYVERKLAARNVLKIRGKIYRIVRKWGGMSEEHVEIGTFVARRRMKIDEVHDYKELDDMDNETDSKGKDSEDGSTSNSENSEDENYLEEDEEL